LAVPVPSYTVDMLWVGSCGSAASDLADSSMICLTQVA
jgi:hypothetical protein